MPLSRSSVLRIAIFGAAFFSVTIRFAQAQHAATEAEPARAQVPAPQSHELKGAAKEPFQRGLLAAQQQDWKLASRYFLDAQKGDPDAPQIWFNLGLAESKLPDYTDTLRAMAWFRAYLLAVPNAPNAAAVRQQQMAMEVSLESRIDKVHDQLKKMVQLLLPSGESIYLPSAGWELAKTLNFLGDTSGADSDLRAICGLDSTMSPTEVKANHRSIYDAKGGGYDESLAAAGLFDRAEEWDRFEGTNEILPYLIEKGNLAEALQHAKAFKTSNGLDVAQIACAGYEIHNPGVIDEAVGLPIGSDYGRRDLIWALLVQGDRARAGKILQFITDEKVKTSVEEWMSNPSLLHGNCYGFFWAHGAHRAEFLVDTAAGDYLESLSGLDDLVTEGTNYIKQHSSELQDPKHLRSEVMFGAAERLDKIAVRLRLISIQYRQIHGPFIHNGQ